MMRSFAAVWLLASTLFLALLPARQACAAAGVAKDGAEAVREAVAACGGGRALLLVAPGLDHYAALKGSGFSGRVIQLTPGKDPYREVNFAGWKEALPVPADNVSFQGGRITGRFGAADVTVTSFPTFEAPAEGVCAIVLDPSFLLPLYENEVRGGMVDLSLRLYRTLSDRKVPLSAPLFAIDPLSVPSFPLQWSYVGELWTEIWTNPDAFRDGLPPRWKGRKDAEFVAEFGQFEEASILLEEVRPAFPKDGSVDYQLARLAFWDKEVPEGVRHLNRAAKADRRFVRGFPEYAAYLVSKERLSSAETVLRAGLLVDPADTALNVAMLRFLLERSGSLRETNREEAVAALEEALKLSIPEERKKGIREMIEGLRREAPAPGGAAGAGETGAKGGSAP